MSRQFSWRRVVPLATAAVLACAVAACGSSGGGSGGASAAAPSANSTAGATGTLRLGYFPNLTHAPALYGLDQGIFKKDLGAGVDLKLSTYNSGTQAGEALRSGSIDVSYIGPNPAISLYSSSGGKSVRVISGATSGGASLVVKPSIATVADLKGKKIASPSLGNTQDVALRFYLKKNGLSSDKNGGGDVKVVPEDNATTLSAFSSGAIDGAWVPEPYVARLVAAGGKVLVDEASQWPGGKFVTTLLLVRTDYLNAHPGIIANLLQANVDSINALNADPAKGQTVTNAALAKLTGKPLKTAQLASAWKELTFTADPIASSLRTSADHSVELGLSKKTDLSGLFDLGPLNTVLSKSGKASVAS